MQALSSYKADDHPSVQGALHSLEDRASGLMAAESYFSERALFARFVWADWPENLRRDLAQRIEGFHRSHPELRRVSDGTPEWQAIFRDWRSDPVSAKVIADAFSKHFPGRLRWVESEKDSRGRISGHCNVDGTGEIVLHLFWRDSTAVPLGPLSDADRERFGASVREVFNWAGSRIEPVLRVLHDKLQGLYGDCFRGLYVFGSYARPDAGIELPENSDLDVALILSDFNNAYEEIKRFGDITYDLSLEHGLVISLVPIREADYREGRTNFARVISSYAIPVK